MLKWNISPLRELWQSDEVPVRRVHMRFLQERSETYRDDVRVTSKLVGAFSLFLFVFSSSPLLENRESVCF